MKRESNSVKKGLPRNQLLKELAEQPISLIRELLQMRLMVKALQLIQLNGPRPR